MNSLAKLASVTEEMSLEVEETPSAPDHLPGQTSPSPFSLAGTAECPSTGKTHSKESTAGLPISMVSTPRGPIPIIKSMMTSACERNCYYCPFRSGRDFRRMTFKPDEMAEAVQQLSQAGVVQGAFVSSGIAGGGVRTQDQLLDMAEILRHKYQYRGYLHLKLMPGAEQDQILRAMQLADRVSVNLEAPNTQRLLRLAPQKVFLEELLQPLRTVEAIRKSQPGARGWKGRWPSMTTQFVVGAAGENDLEVLQTVDYLYRNLRLARAYFSGFHPVAQTPLEELPAIVPWRQHRLYQASFLLRDYGFGVEDLPFEGDGLLPLGVDPKLAWARSNLNEAPIELNKASRQDLLRIPGIGPKGAQVIFTFLQGGGQFKRVEDLKNLGVYSTRAAPFILIDGKQAPTQLSLF